ncbi:MAG: class I SAM-dependent methyltransferase [Hyphomicrobium sp.]|nr:class I SAM-dependent methyltransferase [Hyphomicrobium sp.]
MGKWGAGALILVVCGASQTLGALSVPGAAAGTEGRDTAIEKLDAVLAAQSDETKARYQYRHPKETLTFFGVKPGMTVVDTLPGPVWYSTILSEYLGPEGRVIGVDYSLDMRTAIGGRYATEEFQQERQDWPQRWVREQEAERDENEAPFSAFFYGSLPEEMAGTADVVLMLRAAHGPNRTEEKGGFFTKALEDVSRILKPGGVVGVVQHRAPENNSDKWANGQNGYLKQRQLIEFFENAGFELVESSEINANPNDHPTEEDSVWRLPPTLRGDDIELRARMEAIGESDRMTLKFRKPE